MSFRRNLCETSPCILNFPCFEEQKKVADFLSSVDEIITASEEKLDGLQIIDSEKDGLCFIGSKLVAYRQCRKEESLHIPKGVTEIGEYAFYGYSRLKNIEIPEGVTEIGEGAFDDCCVLDEVNIPDSVKEIGSFAFACCVLSNLTVPSSVENIGTEAFYHLPNVNYQGDASGAPWGAKALNGNAQ